MDIDDPFIFHVRVVAPNRVEYLSATQGLAWMAGQKDEQTELGGVKFSS